MVKSSRSWYPHIQKLPWLHKPAIKRQQILPRILATLPSFHSITQKNSPVKTLNRHSVNPITPPKTSYFSLLTMASPPSPKPQSTMHKTTLAILAAYEHQSIDEIMSFRTPDCIHTVFPCNLYPFISSIFHPPSPLLRCNFPDQHGNPLTATASLPRTPMSNTAYRTFFAATIPKNLELPYQNLRCHRIASI